MGMIRLKIRLGVRRQMKLMRFREGIILRKIGDKLLINWTGNHEQILCSESKTEECMVLNTQETRSTGASFSLREQFRR